MSASPLHSAHETPPRLSITTVVPTVGRPHLQASLNSVLDQDLDGIDLSLVVVNDSGGPLPSGLVPADPRLQVVNTGTGRMGCGTARAAGAVLARGRYLHFFDDDDLMLPGAFQAFRRAYEAHPTVEWIHGCVERVSRTGAPLDPLPPDIEGKVLAPLLTGEWLPLQASLVRASLYFAVGGFNPRYPTSEDMDLMMRMALRAEVLRIPEVVLRYSSGPEESASLRSMDVEYLLEAHEALFDTPGALQQLLASARSPYGRSQVLRNYLISAKQNARLGAYSKLLLRLLQAAGVTVRSGLDGLRPSFWRGAFAPYRGREYARSQEKT